MHMMILPLPWLDLLETTAQAALILLVATITYTVCRAAVGGTTGRPMRIDEINTIIERGHDEASLRAALDGLRSRVEELELSTDSIERELKNLRSELGVPNVLHTMRCTCDDTSVPPALCVACTLNASRCVVPSACRRSL